MATITHRRRAVFSSSYDAIVIGSGIGGLTTAACLARAGFRVAVLERHTKVGGFTHSFARGGYSWDVGVHYIGQVHQGTSLTRRLFDYVSNDSIVWSKMPNPYDTIVLGDREYQYVAGRRPFAEQMQRYFPGQAGAIERYLCLLDEVSSAAFKYFALKAMPLQLADLLWRPMASGFLRWAQCTTKDVLSSFVTDKELAAVLTGIWGNYGLPPSESSFAMHALVARHYLDGASYPVGGAQAIAEAIVPVITDHGGLVVSSAEVAEILVRRQRAYGVRLVSKEEIMAKNIVSAAGLGVTARRLLPGELKTTTLLRERVSHLGPSTAHIGVFLGLRGRHDQLGLSSSNLWLHDQSLAFPGRSEQEVATKRNPVVFVSFPSTKDPSWPLRHGECSTIEMVVLTDYNAFTPWLESKWQCRGQDYQELKQQIREWAIATLTNRFPKIKDHIEVCEVSTPLSTNHFAGYDYGEIYGLSHGTKRFAQRWLHPQSSIDGLYFSGQDVATCGVAGACLGGALAALRILGPIRGAPLARLLARTP